MAVACSETTPADHTRTARQGLDLHWYVIKVKPRKEVYVQMQLQSCAGIETYCPLMKTARRYLRKWQKQVEPVFPGYVFVRLDPLTQIIHLRRLHGYDSLVRFNGRPAEVSSECIEELRGKENRQGYIRYRPLQPLRAETPVRVVEGPFRGQTGAILHYREGAQRVCLLIELMNSRTLLELPRDSVEAVAV